MDIKWSVLEANKRKVFKRLYIAALCGISESHASRLFADCGYDPRVVRAWIDSENRLDRANQPVEEAIERALRRVEARHYKELRRLQEEREELERANEPFFPGSPGEIGDYEPDPQEPPF